MKIGKHKASKGKLMDFIKMLNRSELINKVILGKAQGCFHKYPDGSFKIRKQISVGIQLSYYSKEGIRDVYLTCDKENYEKVVNYLKHTNI